MSTVVHQLRIDTDLDDTHAVQSRVAAQLGAADLSPAGLPPGATLVVRRLGRDLPVWHLDPRAIRPPADWQAAALDRLADCLRRAVWVQAGVVPEAAETIVFPEDAEILAAQASDWVAGALQSRWCWRSLFPREEPVTAMVRTWLEKPESVPPAIERLALARRAEPFLQRLPDPVIESILQSVLHTFALRHIEAVVARLTSTVDAPGSRPAVALLDSSAPIPRDVTETLTRDEPRAVPQILRELLLEVALKLQRSPRSARSSEFGQRLQARLIAPDTAAVRCTETPRPLTPTPSPAEMTAVLPDQPASRNFTSAPPPPTPPVPTPDAPSTGMSASTQLAIPRPIPLAEPFEIIEIHTAFGGIFYLVNLAIYLGYYGDFSTPEESGIELPIWDFLAQTGLALAGKPLLKDPVWPFLESLGEGEPWDQLDDAMLCIREWLDDRVPDFTLRHTARVTLSATRLDIFLSLDELPIEIRIARLDRDPGWIPAAGRFVAFHFR